jgi:hypothetical protein
MDRGPVGWTVVLAEVQTWTSNLEAAHACAGTYLSMLDIAVTARTGPVNHHDKYVGGLLRFTARKSGELVRRYPLGVAGITLACYLATRHGERVTYRALYPLRNANSPIHPRFLRPSSRMQTNTPPSGTKHEIRKSQSPHPRTQMGPGSVAHIFLPLSRNNKDTQLQIGNPKPISRSSG